MEVQAIDHKKRQQEEIAMTNPDQHYLYEDMIANLNEQLRQILGL